MRAFRTAAEVVRTLGSAEIERRAAEGTLKELQGIGDVTARTIAESLGGVESLIEVPAAMTHMSVSETALAVDPALIRLSVGIEGVDDLMGVGEAIEVRCEARPLDELGRDAGRPGDVLERRVGAALAEGDRSRLEQALPVAAGVGPLRTRHDRASLDLLENFIC